MPALASVSGVPENVRTPPETVPHVAEKAMVASKCAPAKPDESPNKSEPAPPLSMAVTTAVMRVFFKAVL